MSGPTLSYGDSHPGSGAAPGVLLLHGWSCSRRQWARQIPALATRCRTVDLDLPGHGDSPADALAGPPTIEGMGRAVATFIDAVMPAGPVVLVGHSLGAAVALETVRARPARVPLVVAIDGLVHLTVYERLDEAAVRRESAPLTRGYGAAAAAMLDSFVLARHRLGSAELADTCSDLDEDFGIGLYRSLLRWDLRAALAATTVPVTVLCASATLSPLVRQRYGRRLDLIPIADAGHFLHLEAPEVVTPILAGLIDCLSTHAFPVRAPGRHRACP